MEDFLDIGKPAVPTFAEPSLSTRSRPDLADEFPLVLTCTKSLYFCETQHRQVASLRRHVPDPQVELHSDTASARGVAEGDWVEIRTPKGTVRARAEFNDTLDPNVVSGQHGWFEPCDLADTLHHLGRGGVENKRGEHNLLKDPGTDKLVPPGQSARRVHRRGGVVVPRRIQIDVPECLALRPTSAGAAARSIPSRVRRWCARHRRST